MDNAPRPSDELLIETLQKRIKGRKLRRELLHRVKLRAADWTASSSRPRPGDQIARSITLRTWHHGIYLGGGRVCHRNLNSPPVEVSMEEFLAGKRTFQVIVYKRDNDLARADTVRIARMAMSGDSFQRNNGYHLLDNNCEHFSTFCRTGRNNAWHSQANVGAMIGTAVSAVGAVYFGRRLLRGGRRLPRGVAGSGY